MRALNIEKHFPKALRNYWNIAHKQYQKTGPTPLIIGQYGKGIPSPNQDLYGDVYSRWLSYFK